jgi:hypothetical protein
MPGGSTFRSFRPINIAAAAFFKGAYVLHPLSTAECYSTFRSRQKESPARGGSWVASSINLRRENALF